MAKMAKSEAMAHILALYRAMNLADSDSDDRPDWAHSEMAGRDGCKHLDAILRAMLTPAEHEQWLADFC